MEKFVNNMKKLGKTFFFMMLIALVIAIVLLFVNPIYSIILVVSGIIGFILGVQLIKIMIPDNPEKMIAYMKELLEKYKIDNNLN